MDISELQRNSRGFVCEETIQSSTRRCAFGYPLEGHERTRSQKKTSEEEDDWPPWPTWPPRARGALSHKTPPLKDPDPPHTTPEDINELGDISPNSCEGVVRMIDLLDGVYGSDYLFTGELNPEENECDQTKSPGECGREKK